MGYIINNGIPYSGSVGSNPNLLINGDFRNPVNQRGQSTYTGGNSIIYTIDRWRTCNKRGNVNVGNGYVEFKNTFNDSDNGYIEQHLENCIVDDYLTLSVNVKSISGVMAVRLVGTLEDGTEVVKEVTLVNGVNVITLDSKVHKAGYVTFKPKYNAIAQIYWVKLEQGSVATPFIPRLYAEELALCKRYYVKYSGVYYTFNNCLVIEANKVMWKSPIDIMRITPSIKISIMECGIQHNANKPTDYVTISSVSINDNSSIHIIFSFSRNYNMVIGSNCTLVLANENSNVEFDAEIY